MCIYIYIHIYIDMCVSVNAVAFHVRGCCEVRRGIVYSSWCSHLASIGTGRTIRHYIDPHPMVVLLMADGGDDVDVKVVSVATYSYHMLPPPSLQRSRFSPRISEP